MKIGYGKLGRSMQLTLDDCGTVGGDVEGIAVINELATRRPHDTFYLIGRNSGEFPVEVGLPKNVINPWIEWAPAELKWKREHGLNTSDLQVEEQNKLREFYNAEYTPFIRDLDGIVLWEGQHGSSNMPTPMVEAASIVTKPYDSQVKYCGFLMLGINAFRDKEPIKYEEIILNADARNVRQSRDQRWPARRPVLAQFNTSKNVNHNRGYNGLLPSKQELEVPVEWQQYARSNGSHLWTAKVHYVYSRLEINALAPGIGLGNLVSFNDQWAGRQHFGIFINEARAYVNPKLSRLNVMKNWVMPLRPAFIHGKWGEKSMKELDVLITVAPWTEYYPKLHTVRSTFTTPSSGSGWATTKPWEAFAAGTVCFFHPDYDTQGHILADAPRELREYLRVLSANQLRDRVSEMNNDVDKWHHIVKMQRAHFDKAISELEYMKMIEERLNATTASVDHHHDSGTTQPA